MVKNKDTYNYKNVPIPGGGYVTSFCFSNSQENSLYLRTDIGGAYKFDANAKKWESLINHVTMEDLRETYPIALALGHEEELYIVSGSWRENRAKISVTHDGGKSFRHTDLPFMAHGNLNGRGTGTKLIVSRNDKNRLYYASQTMGLWISKDNGNTFNKCEGMEEDYLTFVGEDPQGRFIIVGTAGVTTSKEDNVRGHGLYISIDEGVSFIPLPYPECPVVPEVVFSGLVPQRYTFDDKYLYVTFQMMGPNAMNKELGYSCDNGSVWAGHLVRYSLDEIMSHIVDEKFIFDDISNNFRKLFDSIPKGDNPMDSGGTFGLKDKLIDERSLDVLPFGLAGVTASNEAKGLLCVSTLSKEDGDCILRSFDYGDTWEVILYDLSIGVMDFRTEYMKPQYNGGHNLIHWMTDLKINPFNPDELWFNTGTGPFVTHNLRDSVVHFSDWADGVEETVHINVYGLPSNKVKLLDIVGDLGGFAFENLDIPCNNSFADDQGNRYITCLNADYCDNNPDKIVVTARGNWTGKTKGGLIMSEDQGKTFKRLPLTYGLSDRLDGLFSGIEKPNVNPGWVAMSADGNNLVWSVADRINLPAEAVVYSQDGGKSFSRTKIYNYDNEEGVPGFKAFSDRLNSKIFYGFGQQGEVFISEDGGQSFYRKYISYNGEELDSIFGVNFALVDTADKTEIRPDNGRSGIFYMALKEHGLFKLVFSNGAIELKRLSKEGDVVYRVGLGVKAPGAAYLGEDKAIYLSAIIDGEYGFYRTIDEGESFTRLNEANQMYGEINSMDGDGTTYGRFYLATGSRGVIYGELA